jgi:hypothetical protein
MTLMNSVPDDEQEKAAVLTYKPEAARKGLQIVCGPRGSRTGERYLTDIVRRIFGKDGPISGQKRSRTAAVTINEKLIHKSTSTLLSLSTY